MSDNWNDMYRPPVQESQYQQQPNVGTNAAVWNGPPSVIEAIKWALSSPDWMLNALIAYVFAIIPIVGQISAAGWYAEIAQRLMRGERNALPKLDFADFGHYLSRGVPSFLVRLVYGFGIALVAMPIWIVGAVGFVALINSHNEGAGILVLAVCMLVFVVVALCLNTVVFAAEWRVELTEQFAEGIKVGAAIGFVRRTFGSLLVGFLLVGFGSLVVIFIPLIGPMAIIGVLMPALVHFRWQLYSQYLNNGGEPIVVKSPVVLPSEARKQPFYPPQGHWPQR